MPWHEHQIASHADFERERCELRQRDTREQAALAHAVAKLAAEGTRLGYPWSTHVRSSPLAGLRELRLRGGRSRYRVLYRRIPGGFELLALAPEAHVDRRGFRAAVQRAALRAAAPDQGRTT